MDTKKKNRFHVILIKPSRYDDEGYVVRWLFGVVTSNSLACLHALTTSAFENELAGTDIEPVVQVFDETVQRVNAKKIARKIRKKGERAIVCMTGVQTNQYARAVDLALEFKAEDLKSMIGGFHVSGVAEMLPGRPLGLQEALDEGITLVAGEVEKRWPDLLRAAYENRLEPFYNFLDEKPSLEHVPGPSLPGNTIYRFINQQTSFDAGRGCPFHCSFCTIINVQGNTMRGRNADDIEKLVRANHARGFNHIFITDDNFARHKHWESIADRLIELKEKDSIHCSLKIQTDTVVHKIPRFIEKMAKAGVKRVFIGLESVNPDNLRATGKYQNQLKEYRKMFQLWHKYGALTYAGYIIGFPGDTYESIMRDVEYLKREIPLDLAEFFIMTPLPGSKDHQKYFLEKVPMEEDTNLYDTAHVCKDHPNMSREELMKAYRDAWKSFYSKEHMQTLLNRRSRGSRRRLMLSLLWFCSTVFLTDMHPLLGGFFRLKSRNERRRTLPCEAAVPFYLKRVRDHFVYAVRFLGILFSLLFMMNKANRVSKYPILDEAMTPETPAPALPDVPQAAAV